MSWNFFVIMAKLKNWYFRSYLILKWFFDIFWPCGKKKGAYPWNFRKSIRKNFFWSKERILKRIGGWFWKLSKKLLYCLPLLSCPVCHSKEDTDTLEHLFACQKISLPKNYEKIIYSNSGTDQILAFYGKMAKAIQKLLKKRNKVLKEREEQASTSEKKNANL